MVGPGAVAKTTILSKLTLGEVVTTIPTIEFHVETMGDAFVHCKQVVDTEMGRTTAKTTEWLQAAKNAMSTPRTATAILEPRLRRRAARLSSLKDVSQNSRT